MLLTSRVSFALLALGAVILVTQGLTKTPKTASVASSSAVPDDLALLVKGPPHDAPDDYKKSFLDAVIKNSVVTSQVDITNCQPQPLIAQIKLASEFLIKNGGPAVTIELTQAHGDPKYTYQFEKNSQRTIQADFGKGVGAYAYYCNRSKDPVGVFYLKYPRELDTDHTSRRQ